MSQPVRILLIDDSAVLRAVFARLVEGLGYELTAVATSTEGLARAATESLSAIVVDGRLPDCDVREYVGTLRTAAPTARVFLIGSMEERALIEHAAAVQASGVIVRPFRRSQLRELLSM